MLTLVLTILLFTALVAASVVFVVRTALRARELFDQDGSDVLDGYAEAARSSLVQARRHLAEPVDDGAGQETPQAATHY